MTFFINKKITYTHKCLFEFPFFKLNKILRPYIEVELSHTDTDKKIEVMCLLDAGADYTVMPKDLGESLGIDFSELDPVEPPTGVGGKLEWKKCYKSPLTIGFLGTSIITEVYWIDSKEIQPLIGRRGFFENFDVYYKQASDRITLIFHSTPECHLTKK
jgi:hypothetical protein